MTGPSRPGEDRLVRFVFCPDFVGRQWRLPVLPVAARALMGWRVEPEPVDAGVPPVVAAVLAGALCRQATLSFPAGPRPMRWRSARDPREMTADVFAGDLFAWDLQGQVVVLSPPGHSPALEERHLNVVTDPRLVADLAARGATGLLLPGVDGDVAGLYTFARADMQALEAALASAARDAGGAWTSVAEAEFPRSL